MIAIRWKIFALNEGASLCASCTWGFLRKGFRADEAETVCRFLAPNALVPFAISECTGYTDRRAPEPASERRIGFISAQAAQETEEIEIVPVPSRQSNSPK
jgi:hypothetical protein